MSASSGSVSVPDVVNKALASIALEEGFNKPRFHVEFGSAAGDGFSSILYRAIIHDTPETQAAKGGWLCCKQRSPSPRDTSTIHDELRVMCKVTLGEEANAYSAAMFAVEDHLYNTVLPAMQDIAHLKKPLPWPRCYFSTLANAKPCLVMEDLRVEGFIMANRTVPVDQAHCRLALTQLARFHGAGMALHQLKPDDFLAMRTAIKSPLEVAGVMEKFQQFIPMLTMFPEHLKGRFPTGSDGNSKLTNFFSPDQFAKTMMSLMQVQDDPSNAFIHGDCHINNMMFKYEDSGAVSACRLIDFQMSRYGYPVMDLSGLLIVCTDKATRDAHWDDLLRGYHEEVHATLRASGVEDPESIFSWQKFMDQVRIFMPLGLALAPFLLQACYADQQDAEKMREALQEMGKEDFDPTKFQEVMSSGPAGLRPEVIQRFGDSVQSLLDWGWL